MKLQVTFKGGAQIVVDVEGFRTWKHPIDGSLNRLVWETPDGWTTKLVRLDLSEVAALVAIREDGDGDVGEPVEDEGSEPGA